MMSSDSKLWMSINYCPIIENLYYLYLDNKNARVNNQKDNSFHDLFTRSSTADPFHFFIKLNSLIAAFFIVSAGKAALDLQFYKSLFFGIFLMN